MRAINLLPTRNDGPGPVSEPVDPNLCNDPTENLRHPGFVVHTQREGILRVAVHVSMVVSVAFSGPVGKEGWVCCCCGCCRRRCVKMPGPEQLPEVTKSFLLDNETVPSTAKADSAFLPSQNWIYISVVARTERRSVSRLPAHVADAGAPAALLYGTWDSRELGRTGCWKKSVAMNRCCEMPSKE